MSENEKAFIKDDIRTTMNLIYTLSGVVKTCTLLSDDQDIVRQTAVDTTRTIVYLASDLYENVNKIYGEGNEP